VCMSKFAVQTGWFSREVEALSIQKIIHDTGFRVLDLKKLKTNILVSQIKINTIQTLSKVPLFTLMLGIVGWNVEGKSVLKIHNIFQPIEDTSMFGKDILKPNNSV